MSFLIKYDSVLDKYNKIKEKLSITFHSIPVYDQHLLGNEIPNENMHYACIACITIDSVKKIEKKNYPLVYLEECKYKIKKIEMSIFISPELESDSESDSKSESKSDTFCP